jgi:hypothetical protein
MTSARSVGATLTALAAAVARSPIVVPSLAQRAARRAAAWAAVRKSGQADAFVLAWIASHVRAAQARRVVH